MESVQLVNPIRVIGVGGGGNNAVNRMIQVGIAGVDFVAANTDLQALNQSESRNLVHLGPRVTRGLGAGANPEVGVRAANESITAIEEACEGAELLFIAAGMGGGTGSGAAPKVARIARTLGAIVVGVVTMPFSFEGSRRRANAEAAVVALRQEVDTLVVVHNDRLLKILDPQHARIDIAFRVADECLRQAVEGIAGLINNTGLINLDFADVKSVLQDGGLGHFSIGYGRGEKGAQDAMRRALTSPLLGRDGIGGAEALIVNFRGGEEMTLHDVDRAMEPIAEFVNKEAPIFLGISNDDALGERVEVTLMAVGLESPVVHTMPLLRARSSSQAPAPAPRRKFQPTPVVVSEELDVAPKVVPIARAEPAQPPRERRWQKVQEELLDERSDPYPMDDLSIPAFIRRRKRASA